MPLHYSAYSSLILAIGAYFLAYLLRDLEIRFLRAFANVSLPLLPVEDSTRPCRASCCFFVSSSWIISCRLSVDATVSRLKRLALLIFNGAPRIFPNMTLETTIHRHRISRYLVLF
jgi:hypothetical protein